MAKFKFNINSNCTFSTESELIELLDTKKVTADEALKNIVNALPLFDDKEIITSDRQIAREHLKKAILNSSNNLRILNGVSNFDLDNNVAPDLKREAARKKFIEIVLNKEANAKSLESIPLYLEFETVELLYNRGLSAQVILQSAVIEDETVVKPELKSNRLKMLEFSLEKGAEVRELKDNGLRTLDKICHPFYSPKQLEIDLFNGKLTSQGALDELTFHLPYINATLVFDPLKVALQAEMCKISLERGANPNLISFIPKYFGIDTFKLLHKYGLSSEKILKVGIPAQTDSTEIANYKKEILKVFGQKQSVKVESKLESKPLFTAMEKNPIKEEVKLESKPLFTSMEKPLTKYEFNLDSKHSFSTVEELKKLLDSKDVTPDQVLRKIINSIPVNADNTGTVVLTPNNSYSTETKLTFNPEREAVRKQFIETTIAKKADVKLITSTPLYLGVENIKWLWKLGVSKEIILNSVLESDTQTVEGQRDKQEITEFLLNESTAVNILGSHEGYQHDC